MIDETTSGMNRIHTLQFRSFPPSAQANRGMFAATRTTPENVSKAATVKMEFGIRTSWCLKLLTADKYPGMPSQLAKDHHRPSLQATKERIIKLAPAMMPPPSRKEFL